MGQITKSSSRPEEEEYLSAVEDLTLELHRAVKALAAGALLDLEASLARQRVGCAHLAGLRSRHVLLAAHPDTTTLSGTDPVMASRISTATVALEATTRRYAMLLKHFGETARIFAGIFRSYGDSAAGGVCLQKSPRSWSCEL